jgi:hypothetical protein
MDPIVLAASTATLIAVSPATHAVAQYAFHGVNAPSLVDTAACTARQIRTVGPNGALGYRTVRRCRPGLEPGAGMHHGGCRVVTTRARGPDGAVVVRKVRRCG